MLISSVGHRSRSGDWNSSDDELYLCHVVRANCRCAPAGRLAVIAFHKELGLCHQSGRYAEHDQANFLDHGQSVHSVSMRQILSTDGSRKHHLNVENKRELKADCLNSFTARIQLHIIHEHAINTINTINTR